jgi:hypothetical protein
VTKSSLLPVIFAVAGLTCSLQAQPPPVSGTNGYANPNGAPSDPFGGATGAGTTGRSGPQKPATSDTSNTGDNGYTDDDTVYRLKTKDSLGSGQMTRDDGQLTAKPRRREKVVKVDSTKKLPTSGTDPKFQGSLLHSSVTSIDDVSQKANAADNVKDEGDPRFKARQLVFTPTADDQGKKKESSSTKADSSPSPSPSPTASPTPSRR